MHEVDAYAHFKTPCKSWNAQLDKSLCKICHYQQNVQQHYYLWDTLVHKLVSAFVVCINYLPYKKIIDAHTYAYIHCIDHEAFFTGLFSHGTLIITVHNKTNKLKYALSSFPAKDQFRYNKVQPKTIDLSHDEALGNTEFVGFISQSLALRSIVLGWILNISKSVKTEVIRQLPFGLNEMKN